MKKKTFGIFKGLFVCFGCGVIFVLTGYLYLSANIGDIPAENKTESVPYAPSQPENAGVLLDIAGSAVFFYLDFETERLPVMVIDQTADLSQDSYYGYPSHYKITADYSFLAGLIDRIDGIELVIDGEKLRYTGVQTVDLIARTAETYELKKQVISAAFEKIAKTGFSKSDFVYIIENSETNLTVPDCYYWADYLPEMCGGGGVIN